MIMGTIVSVNIGTMAKSRTIEVDQILYSRPISGKEIKALLNNL